MVEGDLVVTLKDRIVVEVLSGRVAIDPGAAEETGAFSFLFADDLAAADAVVDESVSCGLTVTNFSTRDDFVEVFDFCGSFVGSSQFFALCIGLGLNFLHLRLIIFHLLYSFD